jgi:hypothetical protein
MSDVPQKPGFPMMLTSKDHSISQQLHAHYRGRDKRKRVYLNALAARAVERYLSYFDIKVDLRNSPYCDLITQSLYDTAALYIPESGQLECLPVLPDESSVLVPETDQNDHIGYIVVQLDHALETANLLGFLPSSALGFVGLDQLYPLEDLFDVLITQPTHCAHLSQWLQNLMESGWHSLEELLAYPTPQFAFRGSLSRAMTDAPISKDVIRGKRVSLLSDESTDPLLLLVGLHAETTTVFDVWVKLCPSDGNKNLPHELELRLLDDDDFMLMQAHSRATEALGLKFKGSLGDRFSIHIVSSGAEQVEYFEI